MKGSIYIDERILNSYIRIFAESTKVVLQDVFLFADTTTITLLNERTNFREEGLLKKILEYINLL
jgi:hypothetical protein